MLECHISALGTLKEMRIESKVLLNLVGFTATIMKQISSVKTSCCETELLYRTFPISLTVFGGNNSPLCTVNMSLNLLKFLRAL